MESGAAFICFQRLDRRHTGALIYFVLSGLGRVLHFHALEELLCLNALDCYTSLLWPAV